LENKKNIRLNCCKVQQRCVKNGPVFQCENIKRSLCWWRGAIRGDVWIQDQNGDWKEVNAIGSFRFLEDKQSGIVINTQFTQVGSGSVTSAIIFNARGTTIKTNNKGQVSINGKHIKHTHKTLLIKFVGKKIVTKLIKGNKHLTVIRGLTEDKLGFVYDPSSKSYELTVSAQDLSTGLFTDPSHPKKYQLKQSQSKFDTYIDFKLLKKVKGTPQLRKKAMQCCHLLDTELKVHQCISDFIRTKKCLVTEYTEENPNHTFFNKN